MIFAGGDVRTAGVGDAEQPAARRALNRRSPQRDDEWNRLTAHDVACGEDEFVTGIGPCGSGDPTDASEKPAQPFRPERPSRERETAAASPQAAGTACGYEIVVAGGHGSMLESALPGFEVTLVRGRRVHLVGNVIDQAALHAALHRLQDLHLDVLELHRLSDP